MDPVRNEPHVNDNRIIQSKVVKRNEFTNKKEILLREFDLSLINVHIFRYFRIAFKKKA